MFGKAYKFARWRNIITIALTLTAYLFGVGSSSQKIALAAGITYHVDCNTGRDTNNGTSPAQAWRSLARANNASLTPGDQLRFLRGCTWTGTLFARWNGTASEKILIGAYGEGAMPRFINRPGDLDNGHFSNVEITGSHQIIEYLNVSIVNPPVLATCANNPIGWFNGFNFNNPNNTANGGSYNLLRNSRSTGHTAGAHLKVGTHHNRIISNEFSNNNVMATLTPVAVHPTDDIGAWGILLKGNAHEVAYNYFTNNNALCTFDTPPQGNSVELYEATNNVIHHNTSVNDRDFSELGGSPAIRSANNTFAYNLVVSNVRTSHFIIARGGGNMYGPTYNTLVYNNTVYYTGAESEGIVCGAGCSGNILTARNNILWAEQKAAFADARFNESNNLYWSTNGDPTVQFMNFAMSGTSIIAAPRFTSAGDRNFQLLNSSPAIDRGMNLGWRKDLLETSLPQGPNVDMGAYEFPGGGG